MKRYLAIALVVILSLSLVLVGCGPKDNGSSDPGTSSEPGTSSDPGSSQPEGEKYNVVSIVNGNLGDKSFFDSAESGLKTLKDAGVIDYKTIELGATEADQPKWEAALYEVSEDGSYDIIVCGTWQMNELLEKVAAEFPDQKYIIYDSTVDAPNVVSLNYKQNDMGYIIGAFAASLTSATDFENINEDKVIGFVGGEDGPVINDFLVGYIEGALSVDPDIKVDVRYVGNFYDTAAAKELAGNMINNNKADIIWGVAGGAGNGAAEAANELGAYFIGVDSDQELTFTGAQADLAKITLTSGLKNIGESIVWFFDELEAGKEHWGEELWLGLDVNGVGVVTDKNFLTTPKAVQDATNAAKSEVESDSVTVGSAFGDNPVDVKALVNSVLP